MEKYLDDEKKAIDSLLSKTLNAEKKSLLLKDPTFLKLAKGQLKDISLEVIKNFRYFEYTNLNDFNDRSYYVFQRVSDTSPDFKLINVTKHHPHHLGPDGTHTLIEPIIGTELREITLLKSKFVPTNAQYNDLIDWNKFASNNYLKCKDTKDWINQNPIASNKEFEAYKKSNPNGSFCLNLLHAKPNICEDKVNTVTDTKDTEIQRIMTLNKTKDTEIQRLITENNTKDIEIQRLTTENNRLLLLISEKDNQIGQMGKMSQSSSDKDAQITKLTNQLTLLQMSFENDEEMVKQLKVELSGCKTSAKIDLLLSKIDSESEKKKGLFTKLGAVFSSKKGGFFYEKYLKYKAKYLALKK